jgi:septal ring-binding cell division protein DamX
MNLEKRQKVIIGFIVVALVVLIWQLYSLFGGGHASPGASSVQASLFQTKEATNPTQVIQRNTASTAAMMTQAANTAAGAGGNTANVTGNQQKYLELVNEYQMVEIQRMIAEDQAAIAQSRAAAAQSLAKIGEGANLKDISLSTGQAGDYELIYTGEDNGEWTATLKKNGQFNDVTAGSILPDGSKVLSVDDNGALLQEGNVKKLVTFNGVTPFAENASVAPTTTTQQPEKLQTQLQQPTVVAPAQKTETPNKMEAPKIAMPNLEVPKAAIAPTQKSVELPRVVATNTSTASITSTGFEISKANKSAFTIQIVADDNSKTVSDFINENGLTGKAEAVKIFRNGKPWFIAVTGEYPDFNSAQKAIRQLPQDVREEKPFVKKIDDVQSKMAK